MNAGLRVEGFGCKVQGAGRRVKVPGLACGVRCRPAVHLCGLEVEILALCRLPKPWEAYQRKIPACPLECVNAPGAVHLPHQTLVGIAGSPVEVPAEATVQHSLHSQVF